MRSPNSMVMTHPFGQRTTIRRPQVNDEDGGHIFQPPEVQSSPQMPSFAGLGSPGGYTPTPKPQQMTTTQPGPSMAPQSGAPTPTPQPSSPAPAPAMPTPAPMTPIPRPAGAAGTAPQKLTGTSLDQYNQIIASGNTPAASINVDAAAENMAREHAKRTGTDPSQVMGWSGYKDPAAGKPPGWSSLGIGPNAPGDPGTQESYLAGLPPGPWNNWGKAAGVGPRSTGESYTAGAGGGLTRSAGPTQDGARPLNETQRLPTSPDMLQQMLEGKGGGAQNMTPQADRLQQLLKGEAGPTTSGGPAGDMARWHGGPDGLLPPPGFDDVAPNPTPWMPEEGTPPRSTGTPLTGDEGPTSIEPPEGETDPLQGLLQQEAQRQLKDPSVYDDELYKKQLEQAKGDIGDWYDESKEGLDADLAGRGIDFSTIAGTRQARLLTDRNRQMNQVMLPLLRDRAMSLGSARSAAFNNARGVMGDTADRGFRSREERRGERGYRDTQRNTARGQSIEEYQIGEEGRRYEQDRMQELLRYAMQYGQGGQGMEALLRAAGIHGGAGREYGGQAGDIEGGLADLWEMIMSSANRR